jgi:hypothetical protein
MRRFEMPCGGAISRATSPLSPTCPKASRLATCCPAWTPQAADTVARRILGGGDQEPTRPVDNPSTEGRKAAVGGGGEGRTPWSGRKGVRAGGFEPPRVAPPGPKLPMRCAGRYSPGLYQASQLGRRRSVVPSCTRSSRGVAARPVSNLVSIGCPVPSGRGRLRHGKSGENEVPAAGWRLQCSPCPASSSICHT